MQASIRVTDAYRYYVAWLLCGVYTISLMDRQLVAVLVEAIRTEFALQDWHMGVLSGLAFAAFYTTLGVPLARLWAKSSFRSRSARRRLAWSLRIIVAVNLWSAAHYFIAARTLREEEVKR